MSSNTLVLLINNAITTRTNASLQENQGLRLLDEVIKEMHHQIFNQCDRRHGVVTLSIASTSIYPSPAREEIGVRVTIGRPHAEVGFQKTAQATIRQIDAVFEKYSFRQWQVDNSAGSSVTEIIYR